MSTSRRPLQSSEILASRVPYNERIYAIGPFAGRVSFSSQQRRAFSLVCDIDNDLRTGGDRNGLNGKDVAIVGSGIAGITAALTVAALKGRAYIFEQTPETSGKLMSTIRDAIHRDAHPTLNFWPQEDIEPFTRFPVLNWHEGTCADVASAIATQFEEFLDGDIGARIEIVNGCKIQSVTHDDGKWTLDQIFEDSADKRHVGYAYDVVLLATGFGEEVTSVTANSPSYWDARNNPVSAIALSARLPIDHYIVSGTGDGGLIEALHLLLKSRRPGNIDDDTIAFLLDDSFRDEISKVERTAFLYRSDRLLHEPKLNPDKIADDVASYMWNEYNRIVSKKVPQRAIDRIKQDRSEVRKVTLLGRRPFPMELSSSPYHRILTTIAIRQEWIDYIQTKKTEVSEAKGTVKVGSGKSVSVITLHDIVVTPKSGGTRASKLFPGSFYLERHGYNSPLEDLKGKPSQYIKEMRLQQRLYADQDELKDRYADELAKIFGVETPTNPLAYFQFHKRKIQGYFWDRFNLDLQFGDGGTKRFVARGPKAAGVKAAVPRRLFGFEVRHDNRPLEEFDDAGLS